MSKCTRRASLAAAAAMRGISGAAAGVSGPAADRGSLSTTPAKTIFSFVSKDFLKLRRYARRFGGCIRATPASLLSATAPMIRQLFSLWVVRGRRAHQQCARRRIDTGDGYTAAPTKVLALPGSLTGLAAVITYSFSTQIKDGEAAHRRH